MKNVKQTIKCITIEKPSSSTLFISSSMLQTSHPHPPCSKWAYKVPFVPMSLINKKMNTISESEMINVSAPAFLCVEVFLMQLEIKFVL